MKTGEICPEDGQYKIRCYPELVTLKKGDIFPPHPKTGKDTSFSIPKK